MPEGRAVNEMFADISKRYDSTNHILSGGIDFYWRHVLVRKVKACQPDTVVDLATGSGDVAFKLKDHLGPKVSVKGLDFCEPMLEKARQKKDRHKAYSDIEFQFGDCMQLSLQDESVDAITIAFGVRNFEDRERGLNEILRVLKPGGRLFILEFSQPSRWVRPIYYVYLKYVLPLFASIATGNKKAYDYLAGTIESFPTKESLSNQLKALGYADVKAVGLTFSVVAIHEALKLRSPSCAVSHPSEHGNPACPQN